jgi:hypothetical protein
VEECDGRHTLTQIFRIFCIFLQQFFTARPLCKKPVDKSMFLANVRGLRGVDGNTHQLSQSQKDKTRLAFAQAGK